MTDEIPDLWADDIITAEMNTPAAILRHQASLLGPKTLNLVEAEVKTSASGGVFIQDFNLVVPSLGGYTYRLFRLKHGPSLYPVVVGEGPAPNRELKSETDLVEYLKMVLSSPQTT